MSLYHACSDAYCKSHCPIRQVYATIVPSVPPQGIEPIRDITMIHKLPSPDGKSVRVTFVLPSSIWAERVNLVGDFNEWSTESHPMRQSASDGSWRITLDLPAGHDYQFRYLVNGADWHNDWHADRYEMNRFGSDDSVVST
jgi:hypothetical protein